jgi:hypothetical protein
MLRLAQRLQLLGNLKVVPGVGGPDRIGLIRCANLVAGVGADRF